MRFSRASFFFQAEDGIRDIGVTGVQTCALPICVRLDHRANDALNVEHPIHLELWRGRAVVETNTVANQLAYARQVDAFEIGRASCRERAEISGATYATRVRRRPHKSSRSVSTGE